MKLRDYQEAANAATFRFFEENPDPTRNPVVAMPTGTGKAVVIGGFIKDVLHRWGGQRFMMMTHVKELIEQNADKLRTMWPNAPLGIYSAGLGEKTLGMPITFAGVQSVRSILKRDAKAFGRIDLVLIDECHLVSSNENAAYFVILTILREINPNLRVIGYSATPYRLGLGMITDGGVFTDMAFDATGLQAFNWFLDQGYLAPLVPMPTATELDVSRVGLRGGEFKSDELKDAIVKYDLTKQALEEAAEKAWNRSHWLIFATDHEHMEMCLYALDQLGISSAAVHSSTRERPMSDREREDNISRFKAGQIRALVNIDVLTTGFDFPGLDCIILLRPTASPGLHVQILGRGTRPFYLPGFDLLTTEGRLASIAASPKQACLVLDFAGNTQRLGPINDPRIPRMKKGTQGDMPLKTCGACGCLNHISARFCVNPDCGEEFQFDPKLTATASTVALIVRDEPQVEMFKVDRVTYASHKKQHGMPATLKVSYFCGVRRFTEWVCLEHHNNPIINKAHKWWKERSELEPPMFVSDVIQLDPGKVLRVPTEIRVHVNKKYPEILAAIFD